jgi:hypothetical protein
MPGTISPNHVNVILSVFPYALKGKTPHPLIHTVRFVHPRGTLESEVDEGLCHV